MSQSPELPDLETTSEKLRHIAESGDKALIDAVVDGQISIKDAAAKVARRAKPEGKVEEIAEVLMYLDANGMIAWRGTGDDEGDALDEADAKARTAREVAKAVEALRAKPEGEAPQAEDAARYRFLRNEAQNFYEDGDGVQLVAPDLPDWIEGQEDGQGWGAIDAAVDAQMAAAIKAGEYTPADQHAESGAQAGEYCDHPAFLKVMDDILTPQGMAKFNADEDVNLNREFAGAIFMAGLAAQSQGARCTTCDGTGMVHRADGEYMGECTCEAAQQAAAPGALALLNTDELAALRRFYETCQDGEGYDVPKATMQRLAAIGVVRRTSGSYYETTDFGLLVLDQRAPSAPSAPGTPEAPQTAAARDVLAERQRQVDVEGWKVADDDGYKGGELSITAACYALQGDAIDHIPAEAWPWPERWWKPAGARRNLVKAGALILADIERLDRAAQLDGGQEGGESNG